MKSLAQLRPVSIAALLVARAQRSTLRHAQQENNEVRDDRELSYGSSHVAEGGARGGGAPQIRFTCQFRPPTVSSS